MLARNSRTFPRCFVGRICGNAESYSWGIITILPDENIHRVVGNTDLHSLQDRTKMLLPKIIHGFKSSVTRKINKLYGGNHKVWQKSYYDHIIRNEKSLNNIRDYIISNPGKWDLDRNNPDNVNLGK